MRHLILAFSLIAFGLLPTITLAGAIDEASAIKPVGENTKPTLRAAKKKETLKNSDSPKKAEQVDVVRTTVLPSVLASELTAAPIEAASDMYIDKIVVENQTILAEPELRFFLEPYEKRRVDADELQSLRNQLSQIYLEKGYVNSGVVLPDQQIVDGIVILRAVEGGLSKVEIIGTERLSDPYIEEQIRVGTSQPLNIAELKQSLRSFEQNPSIETIDAQLLPMANYGESLLKVRVKERKPYSFGVAANNYRSAAIGQEQLRLQANYRNGLRSGDDLSGEVGLTQGANEYLLRYGVPIPWRQLSFDLYAAKTSAAVVAPQFADLKFRSEASAQGVGLTLPLWKKFGNELLLSTRFDIKRNETFVDNIPFSFSSGTPEGGKSRDSVISAAVNWNRHFGSQILSLSGGAKLGVDMLGATIAPGSADGKFVTLLAQTQYLQQIDTRRGYLSARLSAQYTPSSLLPMEKLALGGINSVRGYQENEWLGDNGVNTVLEWHIPNTIEVTGLSNIKMEWFPFIDYGIVWDNAVVSPTKHLTSLGAAIKAQILKNLSTELAWGYIVNSDDKYDGPYKGLSLGLQYRYPG